MTIDTYIRSDEFRYFLDEPLRKNACQAVEKFFADFQVVDNVQLHSIPVVIQAGGLSELKALTDNQKKKNSKMKNKKFWEFLWDLIFAYPGYEFSLSSCLETLPGIKTLMEDETAASEKKEQRRIRKANRKMLDEVIGHVIPIYFEHFNCHYFYMNR